MYYDKLMQESTLFELFKSEAYTDTVKSLKLAEATINEKLLSYEDGSWTKRRLLGVQKTVKDEISKAYSKTLDQLTEELKDVSSVVNNNILNTTKVPIKTIEKITDPNKVIQGYTASDLFKATEDNHARQLNVIIGSGVAQGKPVAKIAREVTSKNNKLTKGQLKTAVFTSVSEARADTRYEAFKKLESKGVVTGYKYSATLDSRTTEYCRNHDGRKYMGKPIEDIRGEIKVHFNCRSEFIPLTETTTESTRASQFGQVPDESYGTWFGKQSEDFQRTVLGKKKFELFKQGAYKVGGLPDVVGKSLSLAVIESTLAKEEEEEKEEDI